eukprot:UN07790
MLLLLLSYPFVMLNGICFRHNRKTYVIEIVIVLILFAVAMRYFSIICTKFIEWNEYIDNAFYHQYFGILKGIQSNDICVICREKLIQRKCVVLKCGHIFHEFCIIQWEMKSTAYYCIRLFCRCVICNKEYKIRDRNQSKGHSDMD